MGYAADYAVTAPARFRLARSRAGAAGPMTAAYLLIATATAGLVWLGWLLDAGLASLLPALAFLAALVALAVRTTLNWRTVPAVYVGTAGLAVEHPDLAERLVVRPEDVAYVVVSDRATPRAFPERRFEVEGGGHLYFRGRGSALTLLETTPLHPPTVAVVFRVPRDLPVRAFSAMRGPLSEYPVDGSHGLLLPVRDLAGVRAALAAADIPHGDVLPRPHATGLPVHPPS